MKIPTVTELDRTQEAVSRDPFLDDDAPVAPPPPSAPPRRAAAPTTTAARS
jgi:hypothetical protein